MADVSIKYKDSVIAEMSEEGTKTLKTAGKYCEGDISVSYVPPAEGGGEAESVPCKIYEITLAKSSGWVKLITLDPEVLAHINDPKFTVVLAISSEYEFVSYSGCCYMATNTAFAMNGNYPVYGYSNRQGTTTSNGIQAIFYPANYTETSTSLGGLGCFRLNGSDYYLRPSDGYIRNGTYRLIFTW